MPSWSVVQWWARASPTTTPARAVPDVVLVERSRFLHATGYSGHGFLQGPPVGEVVCGLHPGRVPFVDVSPLSVDRFAADALRPEVHLV